MADSSSIRPWSSPRTSTLAMSVCGQHLRIPWTLPSPMLQPSKVGFSPCRETVRSLGVHCQARWSHRHPRIERIQDVVFFFPFLSSVVWNAPQDFGTYLPGRVHCPNICLTIRTWFFTACCCCKHVEKCVTRTLRSHGDFWSACLQQGVLRQEEP